MIENIEEAQLQFHFGSEDGITLSKWEGEPTFQDYWNLIEQLRDEMKEVMESEGVLD